MRTEMWSQIVQAFARANVATEKQLRAYPDKKPETEQVFGYVDSDLLQHLKLFNHDSPTE